MPASAHPVPPWTPWALVILALLVRCVGLGWGLPLVLEEAYPVKVALRMWGMGDGAVRLDPGFYRYPSLMFGIDFVVIGLLRTWFVVIGAAKDGASLALLQAADPTPFYLAGRIVTATLGALTVVPAWRIARAAGGTTVAIVAALLLALHPLHVLHSQMIEVDVPLTLFVTWALWRAIHLHSTGAAASWRDALLCGLAVGLAASTKYPGALAIGPPVLAIALTRKSRSIGASTRLIAFVVLAAGVTFAATSPFVLLNADAAVRDIAAERAHQELGHFGSGEDSAWGFLARTFTIGLWGWVGGVGVLAGACGALMVRRQAWAGLAVVFIASLFLLFGPSAVKAERYLLPVVPCGVVFLALSITALSARARSSAARLTLATGLVLACLLGTLPQWKAVLDRSGPDSRLGAKSWIEAHVKPGSLVVSELYGPPLVSPLQFAGAIERGSFHLVHDRRPEVRYWLIPIPMFQVQSERSAVYYDPRLYPSADVWIVTGAVRDRYRREPARYPVQCAFYRWLEGSWREVARVPASPGGGPEIVIYRNPAHEMPFGERPIAVPPPTPLMRDMGGIGGESAFYRAWGLNCLGFGRREPAARAFEWALAFPVQSGGVTREELLLDLAASRGAP